MPGTTRTVLARGAPGLFSADRVDDGTRLLLSLLPAGVPRDVLDVGCGWGALSLAVASAFPDALVHAVDRDLLAVATCASNARALGLPSITAEGSLGTAALPPDARFDWVLCNVPARLGEPAIAHLLACGAGRLRAGGAQHVVVLEDLVATTQSAAAARGLETTVVGRGARHAVLATGPHDAPVDEASLAPYARDEIVVDGRSLARPADLGEEPAHLRDALPFLVELLPKRAEGLRAAVLRGGPGGIALALAARGAGVRAVDRDLLAAAFTHANAERLGLAVDVRTAAWLPDAIAELTADLVVGEPSEPAGLDAARRELVAVRARLAPSGRAVWLARERFAAAIRESVPGVRVLAARARYVALDVPAAKGN